MSKLPKDINRVGEKTLNNKGYEMEIIQYFSAKNIVVRFLHNEEIVRGASYSNFKKGLIKSMYSPSIYGVGYLGNGIQYVNGERTKSFIYWSNMMKRCYNIKSMEDNYKDKTVCKEWHNFEIFQKWFDANYYEIEGERMELDKDIIDKGNKVYSPEACIFVPKRINMLFVKSNKIRGKFPIGVSIHKASGKYIADINKKNKSERIGYFDSIEDAFESYKKTKENYIKEMADEYKDKIPQKLYDAMYRYEVEITD